MASILNNGETLLVGTAGNDWFLDYDGEDSGQTMAGGAGNDVYDVDSTGDYVLENAGGGIDTVIVVDGVQYWDAYAYWDAYDSWVEGYWSGEDYYPGYWQGGYDGAWADGLSGDYTLDANVENLMVYSVGDFAFYGNAEANVIDISHTSGEDGGELYGQAGNDTLIGSNGFAFYDDDEGILYHVGGSDWLDGGTGADRMTGGWGDDHYYVDNAGDLVIEVTDIPTTTLSEEQGDDTVYSDITYTAPTGVENVRLWGTAGEDYSDSTSAINATGNGLDNDLYGNAGNNILTGLAGDDYLFGNYGNDGLAGGAGEDMLVGGAGNDNLDGGDADDVLFGDALPNLTMDANGGNDILAGGNGDDYLRGGWGNDRLDGGNDDDFLVDVYGEDGSGSDTLLGGAGNDMLLAGWGADRLEGGAGNDVLHDIGEDGATNVLLGGDNDDVLVAIGRGGASTLEGGAGNDVLIIGTGDDGGEDGPPHLDQQMFGEDGFSDFVLNGGAGDDSYFILGHESAEELTILDSAGNDTIYLENGEDSLREILGTDVGEDSLGFLGTVSQSEDMDFFTMAAGIENLYADGLNDGDINDGDNAMYLVGNVSDNRMVGTDDRDVLIGGAGNDTLEGGASADDLVGGAGNDLYVLGDIFNSSGNDTVVEAANEGTDTVWAYQSYKLENNVEHLRLFGSDDLRGTGNALDNSITGNGGNNVLSGGIGNDVLDGGADNDALYGGLGADRLDGGSGGDFMNGGGGNDTYFVDSCNDQVFEFSDLQIGIPGGAADIVFSSVNFTLGANIENLTLTGSEPGSADIDGFGNDLNNVIVGNVGNNWLGDGSIGWAYPDATTITAGGGKDSLIGGAGNDEYYVDWLGTAEIDVITDSGGTDDQVNLHVTSPGLSYSLTLGAGSLAGIEHLAIYGNYNNSAPLFGGFNITGSVANNYIYGSDENDTIAGGGGNDELNGYDGNDVLRGDANDDWLYGGNGDNTLEGGAGNDYLYSNGYDSLDRLVGGDGNDTYFVGGDSLEDKTIVETSLAAGGSNDVIEAWGQDIDLTDSNVEGAVVKGYGWGDITATGTSANNFFRVLDDNADGGSATLDEVTLIGNTGNDFYLVESAADDGNIFIVEATAASGGVDTVRSFVDFSLDEGVENLALAASYEANGYFNYGATVGYGNAGNNTITGNAGGHDFLNGSVYTSWHGNDLYGMGGNDNLIGDKGDDWLDGDSSEDQNLIGADRMAGGKGDDTYVVNKVGATADVVVELDKEGDDEVLVDNRTGTLSYTLAANVEDGALMDGNWGGGPGNNGGTLVGNQLDNDLYAYGSGSNRLDGAAGNDYLSGGSGSDTLVGGTGNDHLYGHDGNDSLNGGAGNDWLDGGSGSDNLSGGDGNDGYYVDSYGDVVTETNAAAAGGIDRVYTDELEGYSLGANVEDLFMYNDSYGVEAVGNNLNNIIEIYYYSDDSWLSGGAGNDRLESGNGSDELDGGTGNDYMAGGNGWDTYYVDSTGDFAMEEGDEGGYDTVYASNNSFNLATNGWNIEDLIFTGTAAVSGIGNELDNYISAESAASATLQGGGGEDELYGGSGADLLFGGAGEDYLDGGAGGDTMSGGMGDDWYMVNIGGDEVLELPGEGEHDTIESSVDYVNAFGVETLILQGNSGALNATGRDTQDDTLIGNSNANVLVGNGGNDWLQGGAGNDTLTGGGDFVEDLDDFDTFVFDDAGSVDTITDFGDGDDRVALDTEAFSGLVGYNSGDGLLSQDFTAYGSWTAGAEIGYDSSNGNIYYDGDGNGIDALLVGNVANFAEVTITEADFIVI